MDYDRLHNERKKLNLTQKQAAKRCGVSIGTYKIVESGGNTTIETLEAISKGFNVHISYWFDPPKDEPKSITQKLDPCKECEKERKYLKTIEQLRIKLQEKSDKIELLNDELNEVKKKVEVLLSPKNQKKDKVT